MFDFEKFFVYESHIIVDPENLDTAENNLAQLDEYYYNLMEPVREKYWELEDICRGISRFAIYAGETYDFAKSWNAAR